MSKVQHGMSHKQGVQVILKMKSMKSMNLRKKSMNLRKKSMIIFVRAKRGFIFCLRPAGPRTSEAQWALARRDNHRRPNIRLEGRPPAGEDFGEKIHAPDYKLLFLPFLAYNVNASEHYKLLFLPFLAYFKKFWIFC